jgi:hypothetical protein
MNPDDIDRRFDYHPPDDEARMKHEFIRTTFKHAAQALDLVPEGRELALAITNLEQAMFWANAAIARSHT